MTVSSALTAWKAHLSKSTYNLEALVSIVTPAVNDALLRTCACHVALNLDALNALQ